MVPKTPGAALAGKHLRDLIGWFEKNLGCLRVFASAVLFDASL